MGEGRRGLSGESPLPHTPLPSSFKDFSLFESSIRSVHYAQESLPHDDTIPDPAVAIKKRPNTRTYPGVFTFSSNGTAAGRPPNQSKVLGGKRSRGGALPFSRKVPLSLTNSTLAFCLYRKSRSFRCPSSSRYNLYTTESTSPCQLASMMSWRHAHGHPCAVGVADSISTRTTEAVPPVPSEAERTRTLKSSSFISFKRG